MQKDLDFFSIAYFFHTLKKLAHYNSIHFHLHLKALQNSKTCPLSNSV